MVWGEENASITFSHGGAAVRTVHKLSPFFENKTGKEIMNYFPVKVVEGEFCEVYEGLHSIRCRLV